ncbi:ubiquitin carboxyl-terminal hydrolase, partial [Paraphaeosphaeria sporulosa]
ACTPAPRATVPTTHLAPVTRAASANTTGGKHCVMSQPDHELMESATADTALSVPASPPPRDSMEDADPSLTRKRPRLDSGGVETPAMHTDTDTDADSTTAPLEQQVEMTIRSQPPSSSHTRDAAASTDDARATAASDEAIHVPAAMDGASSGANDADGADDSSADSPPIIAIDDDDDDDGDADPMAGYATAASFGVDYDPDAHLSMFPFAHNGDYMYAAQEIAKYIQSNSQVDGAILNQVSDWLDGLPDQPLAWLSFYVNQAGLWEEICCVAWRLLNRKTSLGDTFASTDMSEEDIVTKFFSSYLRLVVRLTQVDACMFARSTPGEHCHHPVISQKHIRQVHPIMRNLVMGGSLHLYNMMRKEYMADIDTMEQQILSVYFEAEGPKHLLNLACQAHGKLPLPAQNWMATNVAGIVDSIISHLLATSNEESSKDVFNLPQLCRDALTFFRTYEADLQIPSKVVDTGVARDTIACFYSLLFNICRSDAVLAANLVAEFLDYRDPESPTADPTDDQVGHAPYLEDSLEYPKLVANAWKFKLLRKYMVKGRMELRVMSIGYMDMSLVELWKEYNNTPLSTGHPVMQYLADFILHERVVDYIISVDSHPQLISRSGNIVGFLVVTHRYSNTQTDAIWNTISHSSDPRMVSATMTMVRGIYNLMSEAAQLYLCSKMYGLPIESYTLDILRFLKDLAPKILNREKDWSEVHVEARPWNICIRVLQDTSPGRESTKTSNALHYEAAEQLRSMVTFISKDERRRLLRECTMHVASRSPTATGNVRVIYILTSYFLYGEQSFFKDNLDVVRDVIEEMCAYIGNEKDMVFNVELTALQYRLELLALIIYQACESIPTDLYQSIWDHLIGSHAHTNHRRDMAWSKFLDAVKSKPNNDFCKQLVTVCVPRLDPVYYTLGMFEFVAAYRFPTTRRSVTIQEGTKTLLQIRGADLLWAMILSAPPETIEDRAGRLLASRYLEVDLNEGITLDDLEEAHVALVEQCMKELLSVYKTLRAETAMTSPSANQMDVTIPHVTKQQKEQRFSRTVMFLKLLLGLIRSKPELNRAKRSDSKVEPLDVELPVGEPLEIKYSCPVTHTKETLVIGSENTLQDLYNRLCQATGCTKLNLFAKGQRLSVVNRPDAKVADLGLGGQQLLVQKAPGAEVSQPMSDPSGSSSIFETTLLSHFDELFACMDADDHISSVIFEFLFMFPFHSTIVDSVMAGTAISESLFPQDKPWQAKYAAYALQNRLRVQVRKNSVDDTFLANSVRYVDQALLRPGLVEQQRSSSSMPLPGVLVGVLIGFLKERPAQEISSSYFSNEQALVDRLLDLVSIALDSKTDMGVHAYESYCTVVEASLHSRGIWNAFINHDKAGPLHGALLLRDGRKLLREGVAKAISSVCGGGLSPTFAITEADTSSAFWQFISSVLPQAVQFPRQSEELLDLADQVFRKHDEHNRDEVSLRFYLATWSALLLSYVHKEKVGRDEIDCVVLGFTKLLLSCVSSLKSFKKPLNASSMIDRIWRKFLFAPKVSEMEDESQESQTPILESKTRKELYDLVLALADDQTSCGLLLDLAEDLGIENPNADSRALCVDRSNEIRAPTGYVGLYNPRAICYMNSLLTQLFMNVNFRKFILKLNVTDPDGQQFLLHQTQKLFAEMQNSYRKSADPREFAVCVKAPEGTPIDINIQMDADEFYNLLFDQWEGQMLASGIKEQFRSFYGGHTINQIKSKECEHVSERVESFFVVQCDVQGKQNLYESLQSFVEGDVMEGDNKYKCESCGGKLVDAVKRTCLKDVPDNLIFHLKRFDFDLVELRRAKINDQFEFPAVIDVSPFKIDHLSDPSKPREEDIFELVGVLVHQGTSENGHYYSYIRERPSPVGHAQPWVEFNDRDVDAFDPSSLGYHAYGGFYDEFQRQQKQFSAYMLFYQRRSAIVEDHNQYIVASQSGTVKVSVPPALQQSIQIENDRFVREYSLYDPNHTKFVRLLLTNLRAVNHGTCSEDHLQESQALHVVLEHLSQTLFRVKSADNFDEAMMQLRKTVLSCATCCQVALKWLATHHSALANLLLHCVHGKVRSQTRSFLIDSLQYLRGNDPVAYGIEATETESESGSMIQTDGVLVAVSRSLRKVCDESYQTFRGWDDLYLTLCQVSDLGHVETAVLLDSNFLEFGLRMFCMHALEACRDVDLWRVVDKKRRIYNRLIEFVYRLLSRVDLHAQVFTKNRGSRLDIYEVNGHKFPLSREEKAFLYFWHEDNRAIAFLDRMLEMYDPTKTEVYYPGEILKLMLKSVDGRFQQRLFLTVHEGVGSLEPPQSDPYVRAALPYCEASPDIHHIDQVIDVVRNHIVKYPQGGGEANVCFLKGLLHLDNEAVSDEKGTDYPYTASLRFAKSVAVHLLFYDDEVVRKLSAEHFEELFVRYQDDQNTPEDVLKLKYKTVRNLLFELSDKIVLEYQRTTARSDIQAVAQVCEVLALLITNLYESDDPTWEPCRHVQDGHIIERYQSEALPRLQNWPTDESTPVSTGEAYDHSDYGSESEMDPELIDLEN